MISRTYVQCLTCSNPITARIQVGHELEQPHTFSCPHCGTDIKLTLILDEPPIVKMRWDDNCASGTSEGKIINLGVGFTIAKDRLNQDMYFPAFFELPPVPIDDNGGGVAGDGPLFQDIAVGLGGLPRAADHWRVLQKALRFHRTGQAELREAQLDIFWGPGRTEENDVDNAVFMYFMRLLEPNTNALFKPIAEELRQARHLHSVEFFSLSDHYTKDLQADRIQAYSDIFTEYFRGYTEFNQTLVYVRNGAALPPDAVATSSAFDSTRMFYGNAFEVLGSHLDLPAAINNINAGRKFDQMLTMDLAKFRTINKANRTNCFSTNAALSWFVTEYDSTIRNASHHRWFKLDDSRHTVHFRSGGTGALQSISYADYLYRCNKLAVQLMVMLCWELIFLRLSNKSL